ncbi:MAG: BrnA antitoxin family protein [Methylomonas sp.]|jgi:uncharacterized protein (DUF4415 family)
MFLKTKSGRKIKLPTLGEDAAITAAANSDADSMPYTDEEWETVKPLVRRGRPPSEITKEKISIRLSRDVIDQFRASGDGWQARIDSALKEWLKEHSSV